MTRPDVPAPARRPSTPVPPLPWYGGRSPAPVPPPVVHDTWPPYDPGHAPRHDQSRWDDAGRHDHDGDNYVHAYGGHQHDDRDAEGHDHGYDDDRYGYDYDYDDEYDDEYDDGPPARRNRMAVWGLVLALPVSPLGLVLSAIGLSQVRRRRERGRGLAIAGVILSLLSLTAGVLFATAVADEVVDRLGIVTPSEPVVGTAPTAPAPTTVLEACTTLMPALVASEQQMAAATTPRAAAQVVADMRAATLWAAAAPDPAFQEHLRTLAADLQLVVDATGAGDVPPELVATLEQDSFAVGTDCGLSGWTP